MSLKTHWNRFLEESSDIRRLIFRYRWMAGIGLLSLVVVDGIDAVLPWLLKEVVDGVVEGGDSLGTFAAVYLGLTLLQGVGRYGWRMYLVRMSIFAGRDLRQEFAAHVFRLSASFFGRKRVGDLMSLATNDTQAVRNALGSGLIVLGDALIYILTIPVAMFLLSPQLAALSLTPLLIIPFVVHWCEREVHSRFDRVQESQAQLSAMAQEGLSGIRVTKAFAREDRQIERFRLAGEEYVRLNMRLARIQSIFDPSLDFLMSLGMVALLYFGGQWVITDAVTLGTFVAFQRYIQRMIWPMAAIGVSLTIYQQAVASSKRLKLIHSESSDVPESTHPQLPGPRAVSGEIEFQGLHFRYTEESDWILKNINLRVEPGQRVALVGPIGSGKSTLVSLVPRIYPIADGMLRVDGLDVNAWDLHELRNRVAFVSQEVFLFSESVSENLRLAGDASVDSILKMTEMAGVHREILRLSEGYDTRLGERGVNVSGGQKQRLTIARALLKPAPILILDDALSAVDVETEEHILKSLRDWSARRTELIIAHRISTIQDADLVCVLADGQIIQQGSHSNLMKDASGLYRKYYDQQKMEQEIERYVRELDA